jgi:hypothetical protein
MDEVRCNRTEEAYKAIIEKLPPIKELHARVNERLKMIADEGSAPYEICHFKAGDGYMLFEPFPSSLSLETVRSALVKIGMRKPRRRKA